MQSENQLVSGKEKERSKVTNFFFVLFVCLLACTAYYQFMISTALVEVEICVDRNSIFSLYWSEEGGGYSERQIGSVKVKPGQEHYSFYLTDLSKVARLRIDTHDYAGNVILKRLSITQEGYTPVTLSDPDAFRLLSPVNQIKEYTIDKGGLGVESTGVDPHFELAITPTSVGLSSQWLFLRFFCVAGFVFAVVYGCAPLVKNYLFVPVFLFGAWLLVLSMAGLSKQNAHPDEYVHIAATEYYADHWLPPHVEDPDVRNTYSVYGFSRLNNSEIYYLCAGKFYQLSQVFSVPKTIGYRFFNICLFGFIFFFALHSKYARIAAIPYLISPQVWYVFSYCDSDAFALFVSYLLVCQLINPTSVLQRYLKGESGWLRFWALISLPIVVGSVFLLKMNYYPFVGIFYLFMAVKIFFTEEYYWGKKEAITRLLIISVLGLCFLGLRVGADYVVNGLDKNEKIKVIQEELTAYDHKKSTPAKERIFSLYMKDRGILLKDMISKYYWDIKTFQSTFGVYGYLTIIGPQVYYKLVQSIGGLLLVFILVSSITRGGLMGAGSAVIVSGASLVLIAAALYHCWAIDFQAQGRYLFPIVPLIGIVLGHNFKVIGRRMLIILVGSMYVLGLYSFIFHGLYKIPKIHF